MTEARLEIKPHVAGGARAELAPLRRELQKFESQSKRSTSRATRDAEKLERAYDGIGRGIGKATRAVGGITRSLFSLQNLAVGAATGFGARTAVDLLIGSNERLESQRLTFRTLIGDAAKAEKLIQNLRKEAADTPFAEADILEAGKRLLRSTKGNIEQNQQLVRQAETLAALNPERTVVDAAEAILDAQLGEFERLKEFSIKLSKKEIDGMKKSGEELGDTAVRAIQGRIEDLGATDLVKKLSKGLTGKKSTLIDSFRKTLQEVGEEAFKEVSSGVSELQVELDKLKADPQFREDMKEVSKIVADAARMAFDLAKNLPGAIRSVRDFVSENRTALELGAGLFAAQKITGGGVSAGAFALGKRALFGKGGVGVASAAGALGDAQPVFVTNWPGALGGQGDFLSRNLKGSAAAGAGGGGLSAAEKASLGFGKGGLVGAIGVGGVAAGGVLAASFGLAVKALVDATEGTQAALEAQEARLSAARARGNPKAIADRAMREQSAVSRRQRTAGVRSALDAGASPEDIKRNVLAAFGRGASEEDINSEIAGFGLEVSRNKRGRVKFREKSSVTAELKKLTELDKQLQANPAQAQALFEEGKLDSVIERTEGLKRLRNRAGSLAGKLNSVSVGRIQMNVTVTAGPGAKVGEQTGAEIKTALEKQLQQLTLEAEANQ